MKNTVENLEKFVLEDEPYQEALQNFEHLVKEADDLALTIFQGLNKRMIEDKEFTLDTAMIGVARTMMYLSQLYFEDKDEFIQQLEYVREVASNRVAVAIDNPQPCGTCQFCQVGEICETPVVDEKMNLSSVPMLSCSLTEYAYWVSHVYNIMPK